MNTKHTPGPWIARATPQDCDFTHEIDGVCAIYACNEYSTGNARLIAAAPELLEALQWVVTHLGADCDIVLRAIAKAKGEQK